MSQLYLSKNKRWEIRRADNGNIVIEDMKNGYKEITNLKDGIKAPWELPEYVQNAFRELRS